MHSYADRYTHDFFFERDYPDPALLDRIFARLGPEPIPKQALHKHVRMDGEVFDKALEKLWIHGGAIVDYAENVSRGQDGWRESYIEVGDQKRQQIELMIRYAEGNQCRMSALVRHFGDLADAGTPCGICDFCAPEQCVAQEFRSPNDAERSAADRVLAALRSGGSRPTGRLHTEVCPGAELSRDGFEDVLGALARAGLVRLSEEAFEKDGKQIPYRKASLVRSADSTASVEFVMKAAAATSLKRKRKKKGVSAAPVPEPSKPRKRKDAGQASRAEEALRAWRLGEAKRRRVPAFRILTDRALHAIAETRPETAAALLAIPGIGIHTVEKYGAQLYRILGEN
jgi:superfamily II DNA helicase RecQ